MNFFVGIFALSYGAAWLWAILAHDRERRAQGLAPGETVSSRA